MLGEPERLADYATDSVTGNGFSDGPGGDGEPEPRVSQVVGAHRHAEVGVTEALPFLVSGLEVGLAPDAARGGQAGRSGPLGRRQGTGRGQGISFLRPLARRRARILRPLAVAMRARNPWVRARRTLLGW